MMDRRLTLLVVIALMVGVAWLGVVPVVMPAPGGGRWKSGQGRGA
ncbi:MAG: hypothetical protein R3D70_10525 [Rhizobiaceae bacterium]